MLGPCLTFNFVANQTSCAVIGPDTVGGTETDAGSAAIIFPAATFYGAFIKAALHAAIGFQIQNHRFGVRLARFR